MRHGVALRKFSRNWSHRRAMFRNLVTSVLQHEQCRTTIEKAKEIKPLVERLIRLAAEDTLAARRRAYSYVLDKAVVHKLFTEIGPRCKNRLGGYTRVLRTDFRHGDAAQMAIIELVDKAAKGAEKGAAVKDDKKAKSAKRAPAASKKAPAKKKPAKKAAA